MSIIVRKKQGESKEELINRFRKLFVEEGIIEKVREKVAYIKPSRRRYEKKKEVRSKIRRGGS
jgi:ribosomal protein S21